MKSNLNVDDHFWTRSPKVAASRAQFMAVIAIHIREVVAAIKVVDVEDKHNLE